ncbi:MAG: molecular chaperone DnaK [Parcubacteria group bacterium]|nr:molecular chaperone DnaK [Parcubacteria group bacterium]
MAKILGIDLGTTNSAVAVIEAGTPKILENAEGNRTTPSVVSLSKSGERVVGLLAKRQAVTNPKNTIYSVKRLIGRKFTDDEVQRDKKWLSYDLREVSNGGVEIKMGDAWHRPEEISAMVLQKLKADAEAKIGETINEVIITVPAYFGDAERQATKNAGEIAGLNVKRILNEPTAAALAYGLNKKKDEKIVVYDFGGGTFDVSVLEIGDDVIEVKRTGGDVHLGGDDLDKIIIEYLVGEFKKREGIDLTKDSLATQRLKEAAERLKHELSTSVESEVNLPFITSDASGPKHFEVKVSRATLEGLVHTLIDRSIEITKKTVKEAGYKLSDVNEVILVGGQTRMPAIQEAVRNLFGKEPHQGINPDEVVAIGAAVQAGILQGDVKDVLLLDVTPLSLGIETLGGVFTKVIEKNTTIPTSRAQVFSTASDNQPSVEIHVLQGEREMASDNRTLARFVLDGLPPAPRGVPQVEVSFDVDANGILNVSAKDKATQKVQSVRIEASTGLSDAEIERMKKDAALHADEDKKKKELVEARNVADGMIHMTEKTLREQAEKIGEEDKKELQELSELLKKTKESDTVDEIRSATEKLSQTLSRIGAKMYEEKSKEGTPASDATTESKDEPKKEEDGGETA